MDPKSESFYHMAILASTKPVDVGTRTNNLEMRFLLSKYGSFETAYAKMGLKPTPEVVNELRKAEKYMEKLPLDFGMSTNNDLDFPEVLRKHGDTTPIIYYRGNLSLLNRNVIAVVGTRNPLNPQERVDANKALTSIVKKNYVIVSGLASGCDTLGHKAGLQNGTIAVLGTPLNRTYPKENADLQEEIANNHLLISQYPIGIDRFLHYKTQQPLNFKKRNQTTVVLANKGVLVLKTGDKGGTKNAITESQIFHVPLYAMRCNFCPENTWTNKFDWEDHGLVRKVK